MESGSRRPLLSPPRGFRDILPTEARELRVIEQTLTDTFAASGYMPLEPPMIEYSAAQPTQERLIQFLDTDRSLVALRPDLTTAVARLVAQRYRETAGALRLSYFAPVFREEPAMTAGEREVVQAGVELIGASGPIADAEVLALLVESLERCGLRLDGSTIQVGHVGIVRRLFAPLAEGPRSEVLSALRAGDLVGALRRAHEAGMPSEDVTRMRSLLGVVGRGIERLDGDDVRELRQVVLLGRQRWPVCVGVCRLPHYGHGQARPSYTGIVFEALHPDVGVIASGGRYDLLIGAYGAPRPATGFAIDVLRLHRALFAEGWRPAKTRPLVTLHSGGDERATMRCAASLRAAGLSVAIGHVAETAGIALIAAEVVDERRVKLGDGRTIDAATLARELAT